MNIAIIAKPNHQFSFLLLVVLDYSGSDAAYI